MSDYIQLTDPVDGEDIWVDISYITSLAVSQEAPSQFTFTITLRNATDCLCFPYDNMGDALNMLQIISSWVHMEHARPVVQDGIPFMMAPSSYEQ